VTPLLLSVIFSARAAAPSVVFQADRVAVKIVSDSAPARRDGLRMAARVRRLWVRVLRARGLDVVVSPHGRLGLLGGRPGVSSVGRCLDRWCDDPTAPRDGEARGSGGVTLVTDTGCATTARALVVLPDCGGLAVGQLWSSPMLCPGESMVGGEMSES